MNSIEEIQAWIDAVLDALQEAIANGEEIPDEMAGQIADILQEEYARIDQLREQNNEPPPIEEIEAEEAQVANQVSPPEPPPPTEPIPPLEPAPHASSNINAFRYNPEDGELYVKFQGKYPAENGQVYKYQNVPKNIYEVFRRGAVAPKTSGRNAWHTWKRGISPSHGASLYALIREGGYAYQRVS